MKKLIKGWWCALKCYFDFHEWADDKERCKHCDVTLSDFNDWYRINHDYPNEHRRGGRP